MPLLSTLGGIGGPPPVQQPQVQVGQVNPNLPTGGIKPPIGQTPPIIGPQIHPQNPNIGGGLPTGPATTTPGMGQDGGQPGVPNQQLPPQMPQQQFGLGGAENALFGGANAASGAFQQGTQNSLGTLLGGFDQSRQMLNQGQRMLGGGFGGQAGTASAGQGQATNVDPLTGQPLFNQAAQGVNQFTGAGLQAQNQAGALSGTQGQAAFDAAMLNNPQQNFLNQRGQEALINARASTGGAGSPQLQMELQQLGQAQAGQQLQQQIQNAMGLSQQGLQAAGMGGQFQAQAAGQQGQLAGQNAAQQTQASLSNAGQRTQASLANASNQTQASLAGARNRLSAAQTGAQLAGQGAGIAAQLAGQGAGFQNQTGRDIGNLLAGTAGQVANSRFQAGRDIAGNVANTTTGLSNLQNQEGQSLADLLGSFNSNTGNLLTGAGGAASNNQSQLATLLANLATGQGTQGSNIALQGGQTGANLANAQGANQQELILNLLRASQLGGG